MTVCLACTNTHVCTCGCVLSLSASVLDRLNPLLEPGGVLHIDERGVVGDGVVAITPHPDFR